MSDLLDSDTSSLHMEMLHTDLCLCQKFVQNTATVNSSFLNLLRCSLDHLVTTILLWICSSCQINLNTLVHGCDTQCVGKIQRGSWVEI